MDTATLTQHTTQISVRALLAHAVRCARRVQPLFSIDPAHPEAEQLTAAIDLAIRLSEEFAAGKDVDPDLAAQAADDAVRAIMAASEGDDDGDGLQRSAYAANAAYAVIDATTEAMSLPHAADVSVVAENICNSVTIAIDAAFSAAKSIESEARRDWVKLNELELARFPELGEPVDPTESGVLGPLYADDANRPAARATGKSRKRRSKKAQPTGGDYSALSAEEMELRARFLEAEQRLKDERERLKEERARMEKQEEELISRMVGFEAQQREWDELRRDGQPAITSAEGEEIPSDIEQQIQQLHSEQQILKFDQETIKADRESLEEERRELQAQMAELQRLRGDGDQPDVAMLEEIEALREELARLQSEHAVGEAAGTPAQASAEQQKLEEKLAEAEAERERLERELSKAHEECHAFEQAAARLEAERKLPREAARRASEAAESAAKSRPKKRKKTGEETLTPEEIDAFHREASALERERAALQQERAVLTRQEEGIRQSLVELERSRSGQLETGTGDGQPRATGGPRYLPFDTLRVRGTESTPSLFLVIRPGNATSVKVAEMLHSLVMLFRQVGGTRLRFQLAGIREGRSDDAENHELVALRAMPADASGCKQPNIDRGVWQRFSSCLFLSLKPRPGLAQWFERGDRVSSDNELRPLLDDSVRRVRQSFSTQLTQPDAGLHIDSLNQQMRRVKELVDNLEREFGTCISVVPILDIDESDMQEIADAPAANVVVVNPEAPKRRRLVQAVFEKRHLLTSRVLQWVGGRKGLWLLLGFAVFALGYALTM